MRVLIEPPQVEAHQATALMVLDTPVLGSEVVPPFVVAGWAIDLAAWSGTGVDAVHVWAYPTPGSGESYRERRRPNSLNQATSAC